MSNRSKQFRNLVLPTHGRVVVNQKAQVFADRRTRRKRSRADNKRAAIADSQKET